VKISDDIRLPNKRIVIRDAAIVIQTQRLSGERQVVLRLIPVGRIAGRDIQFSIRAKSRPGAGMVW
jgi:hypothetical protein